MKEAIASPRDGGLARRTNIAGLGQRLRPRGARRRRRLCLRRGDRRCSKASKASAAWCAPSRRCRRSRACSASRRSSTTCCRFAAVPCILAKGGEAYDDFGMGRSRGTMPFQLAGNIKHGGLFETAFGITLRRDRRGHRRRHGHAAGRCAPCRSAGRSAPIFPRALFDTPFDYEAFAAQRRPGRPRRHRGVRRHASTWRSRRASPWSSAPSNRCGKCTPCRIGSTRGVESIDKHRRRRRTARRTSRCSKTCATP